MYIFCCGKKRADKVVAERRRAGIEEHRNTAKSKHPSLLGRLVSVIFATTYNNNNNNDFISIALFHVKHAQLR